jgi:hypothetical protein
MSDEQQSAPKIIVDDDWKSRAQAEKEQLQREAESKQRAEPAKSTRDKPASNAPKPESDVPLPPASFPVLVTSLATQALAAMGQFPDADGKPAMQLSHAKHFIDTLAVLEEKTKGNLTSDESAMLTSALHELRLLFVMTGKQPASKPSG